MTVRRVRLLQTTLTTSSVTTRGRVLRRLLSGRRMRWANSVRCAGLLLSSLCAAALSAQSLAPGSLVRVDGLAAVVGGAEQGDPERIILRSDVELRARLLLLKHDPERGLFGELPASLLSATLEELIGEQLIAAEAERVQIAAPRGSEIAREREAMEREAGGHRLVAQLFGRLDASASELDDMARRRAVVGAFLRANLEGASMVSEAEIDARLRADAAKYAGVDPAQARAVVRAAIAKLALARNVERWVRMLRARTRVRVFALSQAP